MIALTSTHEPRAGFAGTCRRAVLPYGQPPIAIPGPCLILNRIGRPRPGAVLCRVVDGRIWPPGQASDRTPGGGCGSTTAGMHLEAR
jgi:hypothetical protein